MSELLNSRHDPSLNIGCCDRPEYDCVEVLVCRRDGQTREALVGSWQAIAEDAWAPSLFRMDYALAQRLMDELWKCGLRPKEGTGSAGAMAATERHLADLQKLVDRFVVPREGK